MSYTLAEIAKHINAELVIKEPSDDSLANNTVSSLATLANAQLGQVAFLANSKYVSQLSATKASAVIVSPEALPQCPVNALVMDNPYMGYALLANLLDTTPASANGIHQSAIIADDVRLGDNISIGANCVIESGVQLDDNVIIGAGCFIGKNVIIGKNTTLWSNISIYHQVVIGQECLS
jgi:UDP-3-O-[3-hydroxymyristoyl] glucosamine N-acyltransferase